LVGRSEGDNNAVHRLGEDFNLLSAYPLSGNSKFSVWRMHLVHPLVFWSGNVAGPDIIQ